jgi:small multidrug resistance family-3 protein
LDYVEKLGLSIVAWLVFVGSALLEVGGDAIVRRGLRGYNLIIIFAGGLMLAAYGLLVNTVKWDFSRMLGVYVAVFALVSVLFGRFVFGEQVPGSTWLGLAIIIAGGLVIQFGHAS